MLRRAMAVWARHRLAPPLRLAFPCLVLAVAAHLPASRHAAALPADARYAPVTTERLLNPEPRNWPMYRRTYDGWGYSPLDRITPANVASLQPVWTFSTGSSRDHQSPPIVNDGHMFVTVPLDDGGLQVLALDAATGDLLWRHVRELPEDARKHRNKMNRGVALYWDYVFVGTADAAVVALDAATGETVWDRRIADPATGYNITMAYISRFRPWSSARVLREVTSSTKSGALGSSRNLYDMRLRLRRPDHDEDIGCDHGPGVALLASESWPRTKANPALHAGDVTFDGGRFDPPVRRCPS